MKRTEPQRQPASADDVREIVGPLDDQVVARIVATGASAAEVLEAHTWMNADDYLGELEKHKSPKVQQVIEILEAELPEPEEARPGRSPA